MAEIFILEDDESIRELVKYTLTASGFHCKGFETPKAFWEGLEKETPDLVILDINLPNEDGLSVLGKLRGRGHSELPVIMLTARSGEYDKLIGLDSGADDYMTKPFSVLELVSRIKALLRRTGGNRDKAVQVFGEVSLDSDKREVKVGGQNIILTYKEFELLSLLMENGERVLSRDRILERIWGYDFEGESRTVDMHIKTLRQKLGQGGEHIETVRGVGYKFKI